MLHLPAYNKDLNGAVLHFAELCTFSTLQEVLDRELPTYGLGGRLPTPSPPPISILKIIKAAYPFQYLRVVGLDEKCVPLCTTLLQKVSRVGILGL